MKSSSIKVEILEFVKANPGASIERIVSHVKVSRGYRIDSSRVRDHLSDLINSEALIAARDEISGKIYGLKIGVELE